MGYRDAPPIIILLHLEVSVSVLQMFSGTRATFPIFCPLEKVIEVHTQLFFCGPSPGILLSREWLGNGHFPRISQKAGTVSVPSLWFLHHTICHMTRSHSLHWLCTLTSEDFSGTGRMSSEVAVSTDAVTC